MSSVVETSSDRDRELVRDAVAVGRLKRGESSAKFGQEIREALALLGRRRVLVITCQMSRCYPCWRYERYVHVDAVESVVLDQLDCARDKLGAPCR